MAKRLQKKKFKIFWPLVTVYGVCVLIRYWLATLTTAYPTVLIDEFLYYSLGRSIATTGKLLYRGQPALYNYILYPLVLSPIYGLLPAGTNFYRAIQLWNSLMMNLAIFPIYGICRMVLTDRKKVLWIATGMMLLPDFMLVNFIFSESLIYPLFFTLIYLVLRCLREKRYGHFAWIGVLGTLLYYTKPGAIVPAAVALLFFLAEGIRKRNKQELIGAGIGIGSLGLSFGALWLLTRYGFTYRDSFFAIYDAQFDGQGTDTKWFFETLRLYPYYFIIGGGILPVIISIRKWHRWEKADRQGMGILVVSLVAIMIGTAWLINRAESQSMLYLRYMDMYLPLFALGCFLPERKEAKYDIKKERISQAVVSILLIYTAVCTAMFGSTAGIGGMLDNHEMLSVAALCAPYAKGMGNAIIYLLCGISLYLVFREEQPRFLLRVCSGVMLGMMLTSNLTGYLLDESNAFQYLGDEAKATQDLIGGKEYLYLYTDDHMIPDHGLDLYSKTNNAQIALYDFFNNVHENGGVYKPFVPEKERGMISDVPIPDIDTLVLDRTAFPMVKFSENVETTMSDYDTLMVARFERGTRIVDSVMTNVENLILGLEYPGILAIYREEWQTQPIRIRLYIESLADQNMDFFSNTTHYMIPLHRGMGTYEFVIDDPYIGYNFTVPYAKIRIYRYDIETVE